MSIKPTYCQSPSGNKLTFKNLDENGCPLYDVYQKTSQYWCLYDGSRTNSNPCIGASMCGWTDCSDYSLIQSNAGGSTSGTKNYKLILESLGFSWMSEANGWMVDTNKAKMQELASKMVCKAYGNIIRVNNDGGSSSEVDINKNYQIQGVVSVANFGDGDSFVCTIPQDEINKLSGWNYRIIGDGKLDFRLAESKQFYRLSNNVCSQVSILENQKTANDYMAQSECESKIIRPITIFRLINNTCISEEVMASSYETENSFTSLPDCQKLIISLPPETPKPTFSLILSKIADWFKEFFASLKLLSVTGETNVLPGSNQVYTILLSANTPNSDYSKGNYQVQYANWALIDSSNNIKQQGTWEQINGIYSKSINITIPSEANKYVILAIINQYDMTYDYQTKSWKTVKDEVVSKEAYNLEAKIPAPKFTAPATNKFLDIINSIINWFKSLFGG